MTLKSFLLVTALILSTISGQISANGQLPTIGGSGYSIISPQQEYNLGRAWVRILRGNAPLYEDALVSQYVEDLTWSLVQHSELVDRRLEIVLLDNPTVNAFAAPGGIIGVHTGLLLTAESEGQLASVLAHELAHLSQRHFASQLEEQRRNRPFQIASILGSILLGAATGDTSAGVVALQSSFGSAAASRLAFSRQNEREADYIGMQTLISAGYSPFEMANMFKALQNSARFSRVPPEFLLTHPVTQARISDALNRAEQFKGRALLTNTLDYNIVRIRLQVNYAKDLKSLLQRYQETAAKKRTDDLSYAIALSAIKLKQFGTAKAAIAKFSPAFGRTLGARLISAELAFAQEDFPETLTQLKKLHRLYPGNHAISYQLADTYLRLEKPNKASQVYEDLVENHPNDSRAWFLLAESYGLEGDIVGLHEARIEYFLLTANADRALRQIDFALKAPELSENEKLLFEERREEALRVMESLELKF